MKNQKDLEARFHAHFDYDYRPRYNAAPGQNLPVILNHEPDKIIAAHWGLMPKWLRETKKSGSIINTRVETLREKKTFENDLLNHRGLALADGFYEWQKHKNKKTPFRIHLKNDQAFAFPCLWRETEINGQPTITYSIITTEPNELVAKIHKRMPVILRLEDERAWLDPTLGKTELLALMQSYESKLMVADEVSTRVNDPRHDEPEVINPQLNLL